MSTRLFGWSMSLAFVFACAVRIVAAPQITGTRNPPLALPSMSGRDLFEFYCASCHGPDGKGHGPAEQALKTPPPDLTSIAQRSGGMFPAARVEAIVTGTQDSPSPAHGSRVMPVWGPIFRSLDANDAANRVRIANIVGYLQSIQHVD